MRPVDQATILVTGSTDGLGRRVALDLAARGATLLLHGRSAERGAEVLQAARRAGAGEATAFLRADLADLGEVRGLARGVLAATDRLDVLVNNAGIAVEERRTTPAGVELTFAVNLLAHVVLTRELLGTLRRAAPSRVVNVASVGQAPIDFADPMLEHGFDGFRAYAQSKLAQILFTFDLAEELRDAGVAVNALHPATLMDTTLVRRSLGRPRSTVEEGARATARLVCDPRLEGLTGRFFDGLREARAHPQAYDLEARRRLRELTERLARG